MSCIELVAFVEHYHIRLNGVYLQFLLILSMYALKSTQHNELFYLSNLLITSVFETGTQNVAHRYDREQFPIIFNIQYVLYGACQFVKLINTMIMIASSTQENEMLFYTKLAVWILFLHSIVAIFGYVCGSIYFSAISDGDAIRKQYRECRRMMEHIKFYRTSINNIS